MKCQPSQTPQDIDIDALREKYRQERDKRLRSDGEKQFVEAADALVDYYETDPYTAVKPRAPVVKDFDVIVLGGGFAGLITSARLKEAGVNDICIVEMGGDIGGTWYWNRYPGVQCDVESYTYLPLLEEVGYIPKERYSYGREIYEHCQRVAHHYGLYEHALFSTIVRSIQWEASTARWVIKTNRGDELRGRFVVIASGPLNKPKLPGIPGITSFKGHSFHTARWDYDYTGGDSTGGLHKLHDKRVAIIGTGATAIQCIPFLGKYAKQLYVFQRTPSYVDERGNRPTDSEWAASLKPGWQEERQRSYQKAVFGGLASPEEDLVCDGWGEVMRNTVARIIAMGNPTLSADEFAAIREIEDYRAMERLRRRIDTIVQDRETAELLKPWYRFLCKRPCFNDNYLQTFNRPNVKLIDVSTTKGVEAITENAILANGQSFEVDCLIFASGFEVTQNFRRRFGIDTIEGVGGLSLFDHWAEGMRTFQGLMTHKFPNLFFTGYTQNAAAAAINLMYDQQGGHIAYIVSQALARGATRVEPTQQAEADWVRYVRDNPATDANFWRECTPGYYNKEGGEVGPSPIYGEQLSIGYFAFDELLKDWRERGDLQGLKLDH
ncbi:MAG TPA: NAD(P)/FAD-dependent oxidoreductase [Porticoccaceae bacterium]